jgi:hypothetical protein
MKGLYPAFLFLFSVSVSAQEINNTKTAKHVNIPGTHIFIVPPDGFTIATDLLGLKKDDGTYIKFYEQGANYFKEPDYKQNADKLGSVVFEHSEELFNGYASQFLYLQDQPGTRNCFLLFGDSTFWVLAIANFPSLNDRLATDMKKSVQSMVYEKDLKIDPMVTTIYTIDDRGSAFKFAKLGKNNLVYTRGGVQKEFYGNAAVILFTTVPDTARGAKGICDDFVNALGPKIKISEEKNARFTSINGCRAYEVEYYGTCEGEKRMVYQLAILGKGKTVMVQATTPQDFQKELLEFKQLAYTLKFK